MSYIGKEIEVYNGIVKITKKIKAPITYLKSPTEWEKSEPIDLYQGLRASDGSEYRFTEDELRLIVDKQEG